MTSQRDLILQAEQYEELRKRLKAERKAERHAEHHASATKRSKSNQDQAESRPSTAQETSHIDYQDFDNALSTQDSLPHVLKFLPASQSEVATSSGSTNMAAGNRREDMPPNIESSLGYYRKVCNPTSSPRVRI